jgi:hyperosmotically inducible protein
MASTRSGNFAFLVTLLIAALLAGCGARDDKISAAIQSQISGLAPNATAAVKDGVVTLSGQVDSEAVKAQVAQTVQGIKGVKNVVNNLTVKPAAVAMPEKAPAPLFEADDAKLKDAVMANMDKYGVSGIDVRVKDGEVKLTGDIKRDKLQDAMKAANEAKPKKVVNEMNIQ